MTPFEQQAYHNSMDSEFEEFSNCHSYKIGAILFSEAANIVPQREIERQSERKRVSMSAQASELARPHERKNQCHFFSAVYCILGCILSLSHFLWTRILFEFLVRWLLFDLAHISQKFRRMRFGFRLHHHRSLSVSASLGVQCTRQLLLLLHITNYGLYEWN